MRISVLCSAKILGFFKLYGMSAWTGGLKQCEHFADKGEGLIFCYLVQTSFLDGHLGFQNDFITSFKSKKNFFEVFKMLPISSIFCKNDQ